MKRLLLVALLFPASAWAQCSTGNLSACPSPPFNAVQAATVSTTGNATIGGALTTTGNSTAAAYTAGTTAGVTCTGAPTASFASTNGIVTHC